MTTFVSDGILVPASPSWFPRVQTFMPGMSTSAYPAAYSAIYRSHLWVFVVINKRANAAARLPLPVYRRRPGGSRERAPEHPMARLLSNPNPAMSGYDLVLWTFSTRDIHGSAFWYKVRDASGQVTNLFPLSPACMSLQEDGRWTFANGGLRLENISPRDLVHFRAFNPDSLVHGMSALEPLRSTLENEWSARSSSSSFWARGARPGFVLKHPKSMSDPAQKRLRAQFAAQHEGAANAGSTLILEEGMEAQALTLSSEEAQYIETRKLNREEVCAAYDTPPPVVHILDRATFSNITEQMRSMYRDTMTPPLGAMEATIESDLRAVEWPDDDVYAEFLMDGVLRGDFEKRQEAYRQADYMTIAEKRELENLPFIDGTDRIFLNTATLPLDAIDAQARALTAGKSAAPEKDGLRTLMGRLAWQKNLDDIDVPQTLDGLPDRVAGAFVRALTRAASVDELKDALRALAKEDA